MLKKLNLLASVALLAAVVASPAKAEEITIHNHTQHYITDFWINGFHHRMNAGPFENQWTGAFTDSCGEKRLHAEASDGTTWDSETYMCGDGIHIWNLYH